MTKRERLIAIGIGAVVALFVGQYLLKSIFLAPLSEVNDRIARTRRDIAKNQSVLDRKVRLIRDWQSFSKRCLSDDPEKASLLLNERVTALTTGLSNISRTNIRDSAKKAPNGQVSYYPVAINISGRGTLKQIIEFLEKFAQEPYNVKITGFTLRPAEAKSDTLIFSNCRIETIVPGKPALASSITAASRPAGNLPPVQAVVNSQYRLVGDRNIFRPYTPPQAFVKAPPPKPPELRPVQPTPPPVRPPDTISGPVDPNGRPGDVVATTVVGTQGAAYIRNHGRVELYKVSDRWENRLTMAYVNPLGIVIKDLQGKLMYVELGKNMDQAAPLTANSLPELYKAYQRAGGNKLK